MKASINQQPPNIMHIDLNSAFAMAEQQAHPSLRGRPMGVTNRIATHCCVIAASYEAKARGVKVGMRLDEAKRLAPGFVIVESDPPKYYHVYTKLHAIMASYSPLVEMQSIDEGIIDFQGTDEHNRHRPLNDIGYEIKQRVKYELGSWMRINVGIAPSRFLAKQAANWHKPDGLDVIDWRNLHAYYGQLELTGLFGIAERYQARLRAAGIYTPLQFLNAPADILRHQVFRSVVGEDWHQRLRGWEVDNQPTKLGSVGRQFVLDVRTHDAAVINARFQYLCEAVGEKLRRKGVAARGVLVWVRLQSGESWYQRTMHQTAFANYNDVYERAGRLFAQRPQQTPIVVMGVTCYQLVTTEQQQISLLDSTNRQRWLTASIDAINQRHGAYTIAPAGALQASQHIKQKLSFGKVQQSAREATNS